MQLRPPLAVARRRSRGATLRVGWVAAGTLHGSDRSFSKLAPIVAMRITNTARWIDANASDVANEMYRPERRYDVVVFFKAMDERCQEEAARIQGYGGRVVFDANVNYYEIWGDYVIPETRPTPEQQAQAIAMTSGADWAVADSTYIHSVVRKHNERSSVIEDNVDLRVFRGVREHVPRSPTRLVWSGVPKKADSLLLIADQLAGLRDAELVIVSSDPPPALPELRRAIPTRVVRYNERRLARCLRECDVILSPRELVNGYDMGHTEYKIAVGMALGLPAVASPQPSYVEAIGHAGGGVVARTPEEWAEALERLVGDPGHRAELGERARRTVVERYSTPVVSRRYLELLRAVAA